MSVPYQWLFLEIHYPTTTSQLSDIFRVFCSVYSWLYQKHPPKIFFFYFPVHFDNQIGKEGKRDTLGLIPGKTKTTFDCYFGQYNFEEVILRINKWSISKIGKCLCLKVKQLQPRKGSGHSWCRVAKSNPLRVEEAERATRISLSWKKSKELVVLGQRRTAGPFFWFLFLESLASFPVKLAKRGIFLVFSKPHPLT